MDGLPLFGMSASEYNKLKEKSFVFANRGKSARKNERLANKIYRKHKQYLESKHMGKIVVFDLDTGNIVSIGKHARRVFRIADKKLPRNRIW